MNMRLAAGLSAALLTLGACGSADEEAAAAAIADSILEGQDETGAAELFSLDRGEADCIGERFVEGIGVDQLQEYGFLTDELEPSRDLEEVVMSSEDAEAATDALFACTNVGEMMEQGLAFGDQLDEETQACISEALSEDVLRDMFTLMFSGKEAEMNELAAAPMMECLGVSGDLPQSE